MSKRFKVWLDSGANMHSRYQTATSLEELGIKEEEWEAMTEDQRDEAIRDVAFEQADWGYVEIEEEEE